MPTPSTSTSPTSCWRPACSGRGPSPSSRSPAIAGSRRTPGPTGIGLLANLHVAAGVGGGPFIEFPYDPPGWTPERRDAFLAEPIRPDADGVLRVPARPGPGRHAGRGRDRAVRRMTTPKKPVATTADWLARAAALTPRTEAVHRRPLRAGRVRADLRRHHRPGRLAGSPRSPRATPRTSTARSRPPEPPSTTAAGPTRRPANRKRVLLRLAELIRANRDELALLESLDVGKPIRDTLVGRRARRRRRPSSGTPRRSTRSTARSARRGPDALSLVTREPIGVVAAIVPWNYPLIITAWKLGRGPGDRQQRRPQAGLAVAADAPCGWPSWPPRPACPTASSTSCTGPGAVVGDALARHPGVDKIAFTGSTEVGKSLLRAIGETRRQGRSRSSSAARARRSSSPTSATSRRPPRPIGVGIFYNSGQTCNAGSRLIVHRSVREELVERIAAIGRQLAPGEPLDPATRARLDRRRPPARQGPRLRRPRPRGGRARRHRRRARPRGDRRLLHRADHPRRRRQRLAGRPRGDLRAGPDRDRVRRRGRRACASPTTRRTGWRPGSGPAT